MIKIERAFRYVKEAFTPHYLPQHPVGKTTKEQRANYQREYQAARVEKDIFSQRRRNILKIGGLGATVLIGGPIIAPIVVDAIRNRKPDAPFKDDIMRTGSSTRMEFYQEMS